MPRRSLSIVTPAIRQVEAAANRSRTDASRTGFFGTQGSATGARLVGSPPFDLSRCTGWLLVVALLVVVGCETEQPIREYAIPTKVPAQLATGEDRLLAAMIPRDDSTWFFKISGPEDAVGAVAPQVKEFVRQVQFDGGEPQLDDLPENWRRGAERPMRVASIDINTETKQLDLSVSRLSRQEDWAKEVRMNVNRWRGQVGLQPSQEPWAGGEPLEVDAAEDQAIWVDLVGESSQSPTMPPFAERFTSQPPGSSAQPSAPAAKVKFDLPEGWRRGRAGGMRWEAFEVGPESEPAEVTVIPAGGDLRGNVKRWLGQVYGGPLPDGVLDQAMRDAESITVDGRPAQRFLLTGDTDGSGTAIDATVVPLEAGQSLFIKSTGPYETVTAEADAMRSFLESLQLNL